MEKIQNLWAAAKSGVKNYQSVIITRHDDMDQFSSWDYFMRRQHGAVEAPELQRHYYAAWLVNRGTDNPGIAGVWVMSWGRHGYRAIVYSTGYCPHSPSKACKCDHHFITVMI